MTVNFFLATVIFYFCKICGSVIALLYRDKIETSLKNFPLSALPHTNMWSPITVKSLREKLVYPDPHQLGLG